MKFKMVSLVLASILMLAASWVYAKATPPGHADEKGRGHETHQGNGFGHSKHDVSPS